MLTSPADHFTATTRTVSTVTRGDEQLRLVTAGRTCAAPPAEVWAALVTPDRIERWLAPVSGTLEEGGRFQVEGNAGGEILRCAEPDALALTWVFDGTTSWVDVSLRPVEGGTLLQVDHSVPRDEHYATYGPGATGIGWEMMLMGLAEHLAVPDAPRPSPDDLPDLRGYLADAGAAWGEAAAADGDDADEARAAARRCVAAYVGEPDADS
ncbi:SRPBCC domain-containing protein [Nocardioides sp.]|uniref:SRPBCC domain-containing protein n=1 Tax=Nocardioides sp. TaxID=35761 RepID=UPI00272082DB|nr:SRPBCC domain-containing protein [Nocardioides sp.]MDO9456626.1 SRPBCC domain-containing protein [Nocardioides sp.]